MKPLAQYSEKWDIRRLSKVAMAAIRVGVYEMKYIDDIPPRVSLNECIIWQKNMTYRQAESLSTVF